MLIKRLIVADKVASRAGGVGPGLGGAQEHKPSFLRPHSWEVAELGLEPGKVKVLHAGSETYELATLWLGNLDVCLGKMQS